MGSVAFIRGCVIGGILYHSNVPSFLLSQAIKRTYDKKAVDLYMLFNSELALTNRELSKKCPYLVPSMAQYSGQAHWMRILRRRIDRVMNVSSWLLLKSPSVGGAITIQWVGQMICLGPTQVLLSISRVQSLE